MPGAPRTRSCCKKSGRIWALELLSRLGSNGVSVMRIRSSISGNTLSRLLGLSLSANLSIPQWLRLLLPAFSLAPPVHQVRLEHLVRSITMVLHRLGGYQHPMVRASCLLKATNILRRNKLDTTALLCQKREPRCPLRPSLH